MVSAGPRAIAVHRTRQHAFSKGTCEGIDIVAGLGVAGDAHAGELVQHLSRVRADPTQPNLRQVHLIHAELLEEMAVLGFAVAPGELGENITTRGVDLLALGCDTRLRIGDAVLRVTGLRNPCKQIEAFRPGLLKHLVFKSGEGVVRKAGIMTVAEAGGAIAPGDPIIIEPAPGPYIALDVV